VIDLVGGHLPVYPTVEAAADDPMTP